MDTDERTRVSWMQCMYDFIYARALTSHYGEVVRDSCYGCEVCHPSQHQHSCMVLCDEDHIHIVFETLLARVDEEIISNTWSNCVDEFQVPPAIKGLQLQKFSCKDWRATMKRMSGRIKYVKWY